jgi:hypothetical protein
MGELASGLERLGRSPGALLVKDEGEGARHRYEAVGTVHAIEPEGAVGELAVQLRRRLL